MKALVIYEEKNNNDAYLTALNSLDLMLSKSNYVIEKIGLDHDSIKNCKGCFGCWTKTPGECVIGDRGNDIARKVINTDSCFILTTIKFGSYSYIIKQVVDRLIPLISPFFRFIDGEVHHRTRYEKYPQLIPIGVLTSYDEKEEELFKKLIFRNRINLFSPQGDQIVLSDRDTAESIKEKLEICIN